MNHRPATADATANPKAAQPKVRSSSPDIAATQAQTPKHRDATASPAAGTRSINRSRKPCRAFVTESRGPIMTIQVAAPSETTHASRTNNQFNALPTQADKLPRSLEPYGKCRESMPAHERIRSSHTPCSAALRMPRGVQSGPEWLQEWKTSTVPPVRPRGDESTLVTLRNAELRLLTRLGRVRTPSILGGYHSGWGWVVAVAAVLLLAGAFLSSDTPLFPILVNAMVVALVLFILDLVITTRAEHRSRLQKHVKRTDAPPNP